MTPLDYYQEQCAQGELSYDAYQENVLRSFDNLFADLIKEYTERQRLFAFLRRPKPICGIYLWGQVGVGKTFMMDVFYKCLPFSKKMRMHFHHFMALVHDELKLHQGKKNPLEAVASDIAERAMVICFDELTVSDITDAMLLARLFDALFARGVALVVTSNVMPDELYRNGLQRERFLPAIELLKKNTHVIHILSKMDYRLRHLDKASTFFTPLNAAAQLGMEKTFKQLAGNQKVSTAPIHIQGREIPIIRQAGDVVWFHFDEICKVPRSQQDYLEIAERYRAVLISNVPVIPPEAKDTICLFVSLVDVFYDAKVRLVISAAEPAIDLYRRGFMILEYARTHSRLSEMQSEDYFINKQGA